MGMQAMPDIPESLESWLKELTEQVRLLAERVERIEGSLEFHGLQEAAGARAQDVPATSPTVSASSNEKVTAGVVFSTAAAISFVLVIALVLRTIVDNGFVNQHVGAFVGIGYGALLIAFGYYRYTKAHRSIPVFATCGGVLVFAVVLETHSRFQILSTHWAYAILAACLIVLTAWGLRHHVPTLISMGVLGSCAVGLALEFPEPHFAYLACLLLLGNIAAYTAAREAQWRWIFVLMLLITAFFWVLWTIKLRLPLSRGDLPPEYFSQGWFFAFLVVFVIVHLNMVILSTISENRRFGRIEVYLPTFTAAVAYLAANMVSSVSSSPRPQLVGMIAIATGLVFVIPTGWLNRKPVKGRRTARAFTMAALILLALALPSVISSLLADAIVLSLAGLAVGMLAGHWQDKTLRFVSVLVQIYACMMLLLFGGLLNVENASALSVLASILLAGLCMLHYVWCRTRPLQPTSASDGAAAASESALVLTFVTSVAYAFAAARLGVYMALSSMGLDMMHAFPCAQSMLINLGAILLGAAGIRFKRDEILVVAATVAIAGGLKVFGYDLTHCKDLPLILSVTSFGFTAAVGSLIWRQRQRKAEPMQEET